MNWIGILLLLVSIGIVALTMNLMGRWSRLLDKKDAEKKLNDEISELNRAANREKLNNYKAASSTFRSHNPNITERRGANPHVNNIPKSRRSSDYERDAYVDTSYVNNDRASDLVDLIILESVIDSPTYDNSPDCSSNDTYDSSSDSGSDSGSSDSSCD